MTTPVSPIIEMCENVTYRKQMPSLSTTAKQKKRNERRKARDQAMKNLGLTKVKGSVSGKTYWE